ncbi:hypothetical protein ABT095_03755 [Kitasatospora sp. NPDC002227]|uniref:hypothetical protein n=1 Tax=Kitasatospora sp. NPDC002227 TaxID=3154773 RepID=UPI00332B001F
MESYKMQSQRNPGTPDFTASDLPPEAVRHYLLKPRQVAATVGSAKEAAEWMREQWEAATPKVTHRDPENRQQYAERVLSLGREDVWSWWFPEPGNPTKVYLAVVPCPFHWPDDPEPMPCPQPF